MSPPSTPCEYNLIEKPLIAALECWLRNKADKVGLGRYSTKEPLVNLELPRFEFEVPRFELTEHWGSLGLDKILNQANLESMISWNPGTVMNSRVFHQAYIKVDEKGTEAAAVH